MLIQGLMLQLKMFFKNKWLSLMYGFILLGIIVTVFLTFYFNPSITFLIFLGKLFYFGSLFCILSFIFFIYAKRIGLDEIIDCTYQRNDAYQIISFVTMFILLIFMNITILFILYVSAYINNQIPIYIDVILSNYVMNVFLPLFVLFMITYVLSCFHNYRLSAILLGVILILSSPFMELLEFRFPLILGLDKIIYYIHLPFTYFFQNIGQGFDSMYGFQNEVYKLSIVLFWCLTGITIFFRQKKVFRNLLLIVLVLSLATIYIPQSKSRFNRSSLGTYADYNYYNVLNNGATYFPAKANDYYISDYSLHIKINRQLSVSGYIEIESNELIDECNLTLYHGYKVKDIAGKNLESYEINGDIIHLKFNNTTNKENISISYAGYNHNLYSNYQAAMLPGYFPWYPMAGVRQAYISIGGVNYGNQGYNPFNKIKNANFQIFIDEVHFPYIINLPRKSENMYIGNSDSLTLIGGQIDILDDNQFMNILPLDQNFVDISNVQRTNKIEEIKKSIKTIFQYDAKFLDKKIIVCSTKLRSGNQYGGYSEFKNYIINPGNNLNELDVLEYYINKSYLNPILKDAIDFLDIGNINTSDEYMNRIYSSVDDDIQMSKSRGDKKRYKDALYLRANIDEFVKKHSIDEYLIGLGKKIFDEEKVYENFY